MAAAIYLLLVVALIALCFSCSPEVNGSQMDRHFAAPEFALCRPQTCQFWGHRSKTSPGLFAFSGARKHSETAEFWWRIDGKFPPICHNAASGQLWWLV